MSPAAHDAAPIRWDAPNTTADLLGVAFASPPASGTDNVEFTATLRVDGR